MIKRLKRLSVISTVGMILILMGGALVTKTDSADGCGQSWPLCHGEFVPTNITPELAIELSHRVVSAVVGIAVLLLSYFAWKRIGHIREVKFLSFMSVFFLILQGLIGAAAVVWGQSDFVLAAHFGISLVSFATVFLLMLIIFEIDLKFDSQSLIIKKKHRLEIYALTIFTIIVVYTGALVRHTNANLVCPDWPFCHNSKPFAFSDYNFVQWIQMGHRLFALALLIWTFFTFYRFLKSYPAHRVMTAGWKITFGLILSQVILGALIVFTSLNLYVALLHALVITCYFGMLSYYILLSSRSVQFEKNNR